MQLAFLLLVVGLSCAWGLPHGPGYVHVAPVAYQAAVAVPAPAPAVHTKSYQLQAQQVQLVHGQPVQYVQAQVELEPEYHLVAPAHIQVSRPRVKVHQARVHVTQPEVHVHQADYHYTAPTKYEVSSKKVHQDPEPQIQVPKGEVKVHEPEYHLVAEADVKVTKPKVNVYKQDVSVVKPEVKVHRQEYHVVHEPQVKYEDAGDPVRLYQASHDVAPVPVTHTKTASYTHPGTLPVGGSYAQVPIYATVDAPAQAPAHYTASDHLYRKSIQG